MRLKLADDLTNIHCCLEKSEVLSEMFFSASALSCLYLSVLSVQLGRAKDQTCGMRRAFGWEDLEISEGISGPVAGGGQGGSSLSNKLKSTSCKSRKP